MAPTVRRNLVAVGLTFAVLAIGTLVFTDVDRSSTTGVLIGGVILAVVGRSSSPASAPGTSPLRLREADR
jgi:hypothetical protein